MIKKVLFRIFIILIIAVFSFMTLEILFRLYRGKNLSLKTTMGKTDKKYSHDFAPNTEFNLKSSKKDEFDVRVKINNFGFRGRDINLEKKPGTKRIFMMGDSFTFGAGVGENETIPFLFEQGLKNAGLKNIEVVNAGVGHSSPILYYPKLRDRYLTFKPDMVMLLFDFSDLWDDWHTERQAVYDDKGELLYFDNNLIYGEKDWWGIIRRHSEVCIYIHSKVVRTIQKMQVLGLKNYIKAHLEGKRAKAIIANADSAAIRIDPIEYDGYLLMRGRDKMEYILKHWVLTEKYLLKINELLQKNGINFALVIYPYGIHISSEEWAEGRIYWGFEEHQVYTDRYAFELIENFAIKNNIYCINILDAFLFYKNQHPEEQLFYNLDGHLTAAGNKVMVKSLVADAKLRNIIDPKLTLEQR